MLHVQPVLSNLDKREPAITPVISIKTHWLINQVIKSMEWSLSSEATPHFYRSLWNPYVKYCVHRSWPLVEGRKHMNLHQHQLEVLRSQKWKTDFNIILLSWACVFADFLFHSGSQTKIVQAFLISPIHATCFTYPSSSIEQSWWHIALLQIMTIPTAQFFFYTLSLPITYIELFSSSVSSYTPQHTEVQVGFEGGLTPSLRTDVSETKHVTVIG
jgi:hypothetical protein